VSKASVAGVAGVAGSRFSEVVEAGKVHLAASGTWNLRRWIEGDSLA
jgi:hypothetical protein